MGRGSVAELPATFSTQESVKLRRYDRSCDRWRRSVPAKVLLMLTTQTSGSA